MSKRILLFEGGNAVAENGQTADDINIQDFSKEQYTKFKKDVIEMLVQFNKAFKNFSGEELYSNELLTSFELFSGSSYEFFRRDRDEFVKHKKTMGDMDMQIDGTKKEKIREFLKSSIGKKFNGFVYQGAQFGGDFYNIFTVPKEFNPMAKNIQIDFEFVDYDSGRPTEFVRFSKNSSWDDMQVGIKGLAKNVLMSTIYKVVYGSEGVVFQNKKDIPSKAFKSSKVPSMTYGFKGSRVKYSPVYDDSGKHVEFEGKPAFREVSVKDSGTNTNLEEIFKEMFGKYPEGDELRRMYSYVGILGLLNKYLNEEKNQEIYTSFMESIVKFVGVSGDLFEAIKSKYKEIVSTVFDEKENLTFEKYIRMYRYYANSI